MVSRHIWAGIGKRECKLLVYQDRKVGAFLHRFIVIKIRKMREYVHRIRYSLICLGIWMNWKKKFGVECIIFYMSEDEFIRVKKDFKEGLNRIENKTTVWEEHQRTNCLLKSLKGLIY